MEFDIAYGQMAQDAAREQEAFEWAEATLSDITRLADKQKKVAREI